MIQLCLVKTLFETHVIKLFPDITDGYNYVKNGMIVALSYIKRNA
jgi:hypothetical protein